MTDRAEQRRVRIRMGAGAAIVLVLAGLGVAVLASALMPRGGSTLVENRAVSVDTAGGTVIVHVLGAVNAPGVYELRVGDRVMDAVAMAGGLAVDAEAAGVNLARVVVDGEQVLIPRAGDPVEGSTGDGRVNLNTADAAALDTLPRVGPALAARIIAWRESHGGFRVVDDLLQVSGVGDATLEAMRELVTV